jgi:hypothetical protein
MSFAVKWMEYEPIMLKQIRKGQKDKCHMFSLIYRIKTPP